MSVANILTSAGLIQGHFLDTASAPLNGYVPISQNGATSITSGGTLTLTAGSGINLNGAVYQETRTIVTAGAGAPVPVALTMADGSMICLNNNGAVHPANITLPIDMPVGYTVTISRLDGSGQNDTVIAPAGYKFASSGGFSAGPVDMDNPGATIGPAGVKRAMTFLVTPFVDGGSKVISLIGDVAG